MKKRLKPILSIAILVLTTVLFVLFFAHNPQYWTSLKETSPWTIIIVILLNVVMLAVLTGISAAILALCGKRIPPRENFLLTAYSSLVNFFGPFQSGPGVRAVYLKAKHKVRIRDYTLATLVAVGLFAGFSALFLVVGTLQWWLTVLVLLGVALVCWQVIRLFLKRDKNPGESTFALRGNVLAFMIALVFLQVCITVAWYYVELHAVNKTISFKQAISYAGAANFALFVSITPDAVGIREAFLVFSQRIHHVSTPTIISANVIDRVAYVLFLGLLFLVIVTLHAQDKFQIKKGKPDAEQTE